VIPEALVAKEAAHDRLSELRPVASMHQVRHHRAGDHVTGSS